MNEGEERILTLHPQGKTGVNILRSKYELVKLAILRVIDELKDVSFQEMCELCSSQLQDQGFEGRPLWYITTVKLDLEARGVIERIPDTSPQRVQRKNTH